MQAHVKWTEANPLLAGLTPVQWLQEHRKGSTASELANDLTKLLGQRVAKSRINDACANYKITLSEADRSRMYGLRDSVSIPVWDDALTVEGDALILSDMQCPFQDDTFIGQCVRLAHRWKIKNLILAGDTFDLQSLNSFSQPATLPLGQELSTVKKTLTLLRKGFTRVLMINGNHEDRAQKATDGKLSFRDLVADFLEAENIEFSDYYHCLVGKDWCVTHPKNASATHARTPYFLAAKIHKNIISTHNHIAGMAFDVSGLYQCVDAGMCADPKKIAYYQMRHSTRPAMNQGAVILRKGYAWHMTPQFTDWAALWNMGK